MKYFKLKKNKVPTPVVTERIFQNKLPKCRPTLTFFKKVHRIEYGEEIIPPEHHQS